MRGSNSRPLACEASVIATTPTRLTFWKQTYHIETSFSPNTVKPSSSSKDCCNKSMGISCSNASVDPEMIGLYCLPPTAHTSLS